MCHQRLVLLAALVLAGPAEAMCWVDPLPLNFGVIDPDVHNTTVSKIYVECSEPVRFALSLSSGNFVGPFRAMSGPGGAILRYNLHRTANFDALWGDGQFGQPIVATGTPNQVQAFDIYGLVLSAPGAQPGQYGESLMVTVTFP
jgi:spore coat protein U-like protein